MVIEPVAHFRAPFLSKFGVPRQSGVVADLPGSIVFTPRYRHAEAVRGLEHFDYIWLLWEFSANRETPFSLTVRPPRLGGNERIGVFASRSPYRPNRLGLSAVRIERVETEPPVIYVRGADLMDGTPIYDIKPYVAYADAHPEARSGFVDQRAWQPLRVVVADGVDCPFAPDVWHSLVGVLEQDPRPHYHADPARVYGMPFAGYDVRFRVADGVLTVVQFAGR